MLEMRSEEDGDKEGADAKVELPHSVLKPVSSAARYQPPKRYPYAPRSFPYSATPLVLWEYPAVEGSIKEIGNLYLSLSPTEITSEVAQDARGIWAHALHVRWMMHRLERQRRIHGGRWHFVSSRTKLIKITLLEGEGSGREKQISFHFVMVNKLGSEQYLMWPRRAWFPVSLDVSNVSLM